nr:immunoglobulin heavy chain junction region [Macaca mulatta]MOX59239.1 immunoglobulin heavy chain junction region [Macaca mulatta]MOX59498.1 immunoglobulin heavy chain junction region [Macaca mulatta]MOX59896.1 immunoglobulin heavy chain junction region [Macaca mulatta]MOX60161.1 immunoglobulin heavy chain junction region [Macaca mulatta]
CARVRGVTIHYFDYW